MNDNLIKMFIGGEEVVSNKEFTINEEMLSASSTILNNCYPKSWELTKDYVSNFYYPKDYSKYILGKGNFTYGTEQYSILSVSGETFMQFTTNVEKEWNSFNIYGKTTQETSNNPVMPSPDYPSELVSVGYENLLPITMQSQTLNGVTFTVNDDKSITMSGTATARTEPRLYQSGTGIPIIILKAGMTYHNSMSTILYFYSGRYRVIQANGNYTPTVDETIQFAYIRVENGITVNETIYPQLNKGTQAHNYIPYGKYGIEVKTTGKNLFDKDNVKRIYAYIKDNTTWRYYNDSYSIRIPVKPNANYVISADNSNEKIFRAGATDSSDIPVSGTNVALYSTTRYSNTNTPIYITTGANAKYIVIQVAEYNATFNTLQIEEGTTATEYEPYIGNTNLIVLDQPLRSIGDTKDLLYIKNGMLYVERKIGSVVLNGSETELNCPTKYDNNSKAIIRYSKSLDLAGSGARTNLMSNNFVARNDVYADNPYIGFYANSNAYLNMAVKYDTIGASPSSTYVQITELFKSWLSTHNTEVQYLLEEPYTEELGQVDIPYSYEEINNTTFDTGIDTEETIDYYWKNYDVLFAGIVKNSGDISLRPTDPKYCSLQILDYKTFLSESDTLDFVISDKTIAEAISMVVDAISGYGFILGTINISQADDIIGAYSTLNKTAYDVFQYLANISGSRWRARFVDSDTMAIDFYDPELLPRANDIDYTQQYWEDNKIVDLTFNYGTRDYRNKQIILSDEVYGGIDYTEVLLSNGYGTSYITQNNIANITSITVNGVKAEVITQSEKDLGVDADFYYTPGKNVVESTTSYTAGTQIIITYTPLVKGRQIVYNDEEVTRIATQTNTTGVISRYENRNDILSSDELENIAETYIKYKGKPEIILKLTTLNNDLFNIGEICYFNSPIADLAQDYMVKSKATNYTSVAGETNIFYTYELTSSFNSEKAINYFDNQRNKATGNIAEGESITRNIDINNSAMIIWENATITEISVSVDGDNALNSVLNSPFIQ